MRKLNRTLRRLDAQMRDLASAGALQPDQLAELLRSIDDVHHAVTIGDKKKAYKALSHVARTLVELFHKP